jgi:Protein of unknown function (DUF3592)
MIYKADYGPTGLRLWADPTVKIFLGLVTLGALLVFWYEFEPMLIFRPVDAVVTGSAVGRLVLDVEHPHAEYQSDVFFQYQVAGMRYMGRKYTRLELTSTSLAEAHARAFHRGTVVRAWYNPLKPDEAVLSREPDVPMLVFTFLGLIICWLCSARRMLRAPEPTPPPASIE